MVQLLLENGGNVHTKDKFGKTHLKGAVQNPRYGECEITGMAQPLLHHGISVNATDRSGRSPIHYAAANATVELLGLFLHHGASVNIADNKNRETPLHFAALVGSIDCIEWLIEHVADVEALDIENRTPLHAATYIGHDSAVQPSFLLNTVPMFIYLTTRAGCLCTLPGRKDMLMSEFW